jgi:hypothetical protein
MDGAIGKTTHHPCPLKSTWSRGATTVIHRCSSRTPYPGTYSTSAGGGRVTISFHQDRYDLSALPEYGLKRASPGHAPLSTAKFFLHFRAAPRSASLADLACASCAAGTEKAVMYQRPRRVSHAAQCVPDQGCTCIRLIPRPVRMNTCAISCFVTH